MLVACIDIGSNTTRLLVAEPDGSGGLRELLSQREFTRLPREAGGELTPEQLAPVLAAVVAQAAAARALGARRIRVLATAGVRQAANARALPDAIRARSGLEVEVLSAEAEARLAFLGASQAVGDLPAGERLAVVDVGGGSTELAVGRPGESVEWWVSLPLGSGDLAEAFLGSDPPAAAEIASTRRRADEVFADVRPPPVARAIAVGGSALSLRALLPRKCLDGPAFGAALELLCSAPSRVLATRLGIDERRVRLLPAGLAILARASRALGVALAIGRGGLREGAVLEALEGRCGDG